MTSSDVYEGSDNLEAMLQAHRYTAFLSELIKRHAPNQGTVLDFGAGIGTFAKTFDLSSYDIICVEPDSAQRTILNALGYQVHESIKNVAADSCDYIYSLNVLEHIEDDAAAAAELYRVLKPGAACLIYVPALSALYSAMDRKVGHHRRYNLSGLKSVLRGAGFQVERARYADSIGVFATLAYKAFGNDDGSLNVAGLKLYDRVIFPLSRVLDTIAWPFFGKNAYALVRKSMGIPGGVIMPASFRYAFSAPALMVLLAVLKGYYVFRFGPIVYSSDLFHYLHYSTLILGDQDWLSDAGLDDYHRQTTMLRMIGYPFVIAAAKQVSTDQWAWVVVGLQIILSLYASLSVWRLGVAISGHRWVGFCAGLALGSGLALRFDQMILTDSPTASLLIIAYSLLATVIIARKKASLAQAICIGLLIAAAFLLRDSVRAIAFFFVPLIVLSLWQVRPLWTGALRAALMLGPVLVIMFSYMQWNELRTGERFITTIPHSGFMISMMKASAYGAQIFVDDTPLDKLAREEFKDYHFREVLYIVKRLQLEYGFTEPQVMKLVQAKYKQTWLVHTGAMIRAYLAEISPRQALYVISPLFSDLDIRTRTQGDGTQGPTSGGDKVRALLAEGSAEAYALLSLYGIQALASITVSLAFFIYPLVLISRSVRARQIPDRRGGAILALWAFYAGMIALVALSEFTPRYLMPVMPIVAVIGFTGLERLVRFFRSTLAPR